MQMQFVRRTADDGALVLLPLNDLPTTGDVPLICEGEVWEPTTGSVVMFTEPKGSSTPTDYSQDEAFLTTMPSDVLTQQWRRAEDVVAAGCALAARRCTALQRALQSNHLNCEVLFN